MDQLFDKMFGSDMLWLAFIQLQLAVIFLAYFVITLYRHLVVDRKVEISPETEEMARIVVGHVDKILDKYFHKEALAFETKHSISIDEYTTPELLALCEDKGWTDDIFYSLLFVDYNEFDHALN